MPTQHFDFNHFSDWSPNQQYFFSNDTITYLTIITLKSITTNEFKKL